MRPPYYVVIFTSIKKLDAKGYEEMATRMESLSREQPGFLGIQSVRDQNGLGITISYWKEAKDITQWKTNVEHLAAQSKGKTDWYKAYEVRVCKVEREYTFGELTE